MIYRVRFAEVLIAEMLKGLQQHFSSNVRHFALSRQQSFCTSFEAKIEGLQQQKKIIAAAAAATSTSLFANKPNPKGKGFKCLYSDI